MIVPVHNAEKTLHATVKSIIEQSFTDIELLLIENGSSDNSEKLCREFNRLDPRIRMEKIECANVMRARGRGIDIATGKYIAFCDADDWYDRNAIELLFNAAVQSKAQIVKAGYRKRTSVSSLVHFDKSIVAKSRVIKRNEWLYEDYARFFNPIKYSCSSSMWGSLYLRDFIVNEIPDHIRLNGLRRGEDLLFNYAACSLADSVDYESSCIYNYRLGGVTSSTYRLLDDLLVYWQMAIDLGYAPDEYLPDLRTDNSLYILQAILLRYMKCAGLSKKELLDFYSGVLQNSSVQELVWDLTAHSSTLSNSQNIMVSAYSTKDPNALYALAKHEYWFKRLIMKAGSIVAR